MSRTDAVNVGSDPKRIYAKLAVAFVTTTVSPPPDSATFDDALLAETETVPVGRKGLMEPIGIAVVLPWSALADVFHDNRAFVSRVCGCGQFILCGYVEHLSRLARGLNPLRNQGVTRALS